jgi:pimeloyl-ACP methyl ester carboxylesterase
MADEFATLVDVAHELRLDPADAPEVTRRTVVIDATQSISALAWGGEEPELVFLHGAGQNAHTWDLVAMQLGRPAVAIDLPGHGRSSWRADRDYGPVRSAEAVAIAIGELAPRAAAIVGMSLGGLTTIRLASSRPDLVRRAVIVDITPGVGAADRQLTADQRGAVALIGGPTSFESLEEMIDRAVQASPRRPASSVRRGVVHNTTQLPDGRWRWRYDAAEDGEVLSADVTPLWADLDGLAMPVMLVKGADSGFVTAADLAEFRRRVPAARVEVVADSGHAVQSDQPKILSALIHDFVPH